MSEVIVQHISKTYNKGTVKAVTDVSFTVKPGELFGLIGPDGAGKTSLFRVLATLLLPDGGTASLGGYDVVKDYKEIRKHLGYMPGRFSLYQDLTVEENLEFFATVFKTSIRENYDLIRDIYVQIEPFKTRRAGKLSGGMKQKLALCCALIHRPKVLLLDEPTTGVDTVSRKEFWEMLARLKAEGITILVSTPYMDEATRCERIALMQSGSVMSVETPANIIAQYPENLYEIRSSAMSRLLQELRKSEMLSSCNAFGEYHHIVFRQDTPEAHASLLRFLEVNTHTAVELNPVEPTIEDCFIRLMQP